MGNTKWEVELYERINGRCPAQAFIDGRTPPDRVFILKALDRLEQYGRELERPYIAPLKNGIYELRVRTNHGQFRLLFFFDETKIIITHGLSKNFRRVPEIDIQRASEMRDEYYDHKEGKRQ